MTNDEKKAVLQFMGTVYGDAHKQDQMIVGQSGQLQPSSHVMKQRFEEVIRTPTQQQQQNAPAPAPALEPAASPPEQQAVQPVQVVNVEQAAQELAQSAAPETLALDPPSTAQNPGQLEFDLSEPTVLDKLVDLAKEHNLLLKEISLKLGDGKKVKPIKKG